MKNEINTHTNPNGEKYYSKVDGNGERIFSFSESFRDIWNQADEDLYGESTKMKTQIKYATGVEGADNSIEETIELVREQFADAVFYTRSGDEVAGEKDWDGSPVLVWETEEDSLNDDGAAAIAEIKKA